MKDKETIINGSNVFLFVFYMQYEYIRLLWESATEYLILSGIPFDAPIDFHWICLPARRFYFVRLLKLVGH